MLKDSAPRRPTEEDFFGAAFRLVENKYAGKIVRIREGHFIHELMMYPEREEDIVLVRNERDADGLKGEYESLTDYALGRLALRQKSLTS